MAEITQIKVGSTTYDISAAATLCTTAAGTAAKVGIHNGYVLASNSYTLVTIKNTNTSASALTLNINGTGAKPIFINGSASSASNYTLPAKTYLVFYDGTNYYFRTDGKITGDVTGSAEKVKNNDVTFKELKITNGSTTTTYRVLCGE